MKEKKIFRKPRVNGLNVPMASKKSSRELVGSQTEIQKVVIRQQVKIYCPEFEGGEAISSTTKKMQCNQRSGNDWLQWSGRITGIEKFKQLRNPGFGGLPTQHWWADGCLHRCEVQTEGLQSVSGQKVLWQLENEARCEAGATSTSSFEEVKEIVIVFFFLSLGIPSFKPTSFLCSVLSHY